MKPNTLQVLKDNLKALEFLEELYTAPVVTPDLYYKSHHIYMGCPLCYYFIADNDKAPNPYACKFCIYNLMTGNHVNHMCYIWLRRHANFSNFELLKGCLDLHRDHMGYDAKAALVIRLAYLQEQKAWCIERITQLRKEFE